MGRKRCMWKKTEDKGSLKKKDGRRQSGVDVQSRIVGRR